MSRTNKASIMTYEMKPLGVDPGKLAGLSEKLIVGHYENNYGGAVKRLNAIAAELASLDPAIAPVLGAIPMTWMAGSPRSTPAGR